MRQRPFLRAVSVGCALLLSTASWAATVEPSEGTVSVNKGKGFKPVKHRIVANIGDSVMVSPGGSAKLVYPDGCKVDVQPGAILTISQLSPCASGSYADDYHWRWCAEPTNPLDRNNPAYCAGVPVTAAVLGVFGAVIWAATLSQ